MKVRSVHATSFVADGVRYSKSFVRIAGRSIVFEYDWDGVTYTFNGSESFNAPGRYDLSSSSTNGRITLYKLPGSERLIGQWYEPQGGGRGFWEIDFEDEGD